MAKRRALLCGYYGRNNAGDEALLVSLLQMLPPDIEPVALSGDPAQTHQRYGILSIGARDSFAILRYLPQAEVFIWGGGSLLQDATSWASPLYYLGLMAIAQQFGLNTIAWGQGIGPLQRAITRRLAKQALQSCTAISVRDEASAALLQDWQIPALLAPDPVWALAAEYPQGVWDLPAPRVAVNLRTHALLTPERLEILTQALIAFQTATQVGVLLVPFQPEKDLALAQGLAARLPGAQQIVQLSQPETLKGLFRGVEMLIGMRLHSLIMAAAEECRCFALSYDPKVSQLRQATQMPGYDLAQLPSEPNVISTAWLEHYVNGEALDPIQIEAIADRARAHQTLLKDILAPG